MDNAEFLIKKIMTHYNVSTITELSSIIKIGQPAISKWIKNNSINPIKRKCNELGIFNQIFNDLIKKKMTREQVMVDLFEFSAPTYYKWAKNEKRKIFDLLNYAFTLEELDEFIKTDKISKIEKNKEINIDDSIFKDEKLNLNINTQADDLSNYLTALQSVAIATNNKDMLINDIKNLIKKYIQ